MAIDGEVMTIHQKIAQAHKRMVCENGLGSDKPLVEHIAPAIPDNVQIMQILQYILDKMHSIDQYVRQEMTHRKHRTYESEAERADRTAKELGLASVQQCNDAIRKELEKHGANSEEAYRRAEEDRKSITGSGDIACRQGDFRAGDRSDSTTEQKGVDLSEEKKINETNAN